LSCGFRSTGKLIQGLKITDSISDSFEFDKNKNIIIAEQSLKLREKSIMFQNTTVSNVLQDYPNECMWDTIRNNENIKPKAERIWSEYLVDTFEELRAEKLGFRIQQNSLEIEKAQLREQKLQLNRYTNLKSGNLRKTGILVH